MLFRLFLCLAACAPWVSAMPTLEHLMQLLNHDPSANRTTGKGCPYEELDDDQILSELRTQSVVKRSRGPLDGTFGPMLSALHALLTPPSDARS